MIRGEAEEYYAPALPFSTLHSWIYIKHNKPWTHGWYGFERDIRNIELMFRSYEKTKVDDETHVFWGIVAWRWFFNTIPPDMTTLRTPCNSAF